MFNGVPRDGAFRESADLPRRWKKMWRLLRRQGRVIPDIRRALVQGPII